VAGNVPVDQGVVNTLKILALAGRGDIPVARGAAAPLLGKLTTSKHVHGENGMGDVELPAPDLRPYEGTAIDLIVSKVEQHPGEITLIPVGPLTNIAMFLRFRPDLASQIKEIVLMGGGSLGSRCRAFREVLRREGTKIVSPQGTKRVEMIDRTPVGV
jgi:inosine-uridine nucleoside N-ribohydrolase